MNIKEAQQEFRQVYLGGAVGQLVTGIIWLVSAALSTWVSDGVGMIALFVGGMFIFPLTQLLLRLIGKGGTISPNNPFPTYFLHSVIAMGATYPLIYAATLWNTDWFYPAFMLVTGAHYLSFIMFYGMRQFAVLAAALIGGGLALIILLPDVFATGGWLTGVVLLIFAAFLWTTVVPQLPQPKRPA